MTIMKQIVADKIAADLHSRVDTRGVGGLGGARVDGGAELPLRDAQAIVSVIARTPESRTYVRLVWRGMTANSFSIKLGCFLLAWKWWQQRLTLMPLIGR